MEMIINASEFAGISPTQLPWDGPCGAWAPDPPPSGCSPQVNCTGLIVGCIRWS